MAAGAFRSCFFRLLWFFSFLLCAGDDGQVIWLIHSPSLFVTTFHYLFQICWCMWGWDIFEGFLCQREVVVLPPLSMDFLSRVLLVLARAILEIDLIAKVFSSLFDGIWSAPFNSIMPLHVFTVVSVILLHFIFCYWLRTKVFLSFASLIGDVWPKLLLWDSVFLPSDIASVLQGRSPAFR